jgi:hypothetical protein
MEDLKFNYRGKQYSIEDIGIETQQFEKALAIPSIFQVDISITDIGRTIDEGYAIAGLRFRDLFSVMMSGRFALVNAYKKIHQFGISWKQGSVGQLWLRSMFLKNAILWYNSCEDYLLQIIWFAFDFCGKDCDLETAMKKCRYSHVVKTLSALPLNEYAIELLQKLNEFHENTSIRKLKRIADDMKHKQLLRISGLDDDYGIQIGFKEKLKPSIRPELNDIDNLIDTVASSHKIIVSFGQYLYDFINFQNMFSGRKKNIINPDRPKKKDFFKKLIIHR